MPIVSQEVNNSFFMALRSIFYKKLFMQIG